MTCLLRIEQRHPEAGSSWPSWPKASGVSLPPSLSLPLWDRRRAKMEPPHDNSHVKTLSDADNVDARALQDAVEDLR